MTPLGSDFVLCTSIRLPDFLLDVDICIRVKYRSCICVALIMSRHQSGLINILHGQVLFELSALMAANKVANGSQSHQ